MITIAFFVFAALVGASSVEPHSDGLVSGQAIVGDKSNYSWGPALQGLRLGISARATYAAGQAININVALRNDGDRTRFIGQPSLHYTVTVTDANGAVVPMRSDVAFGSGGSVGYHTLSLVSGDAIQSAFKFARLYAVGPGQYHIVVSLSLEERASVDSLTRLSVETLTSAPVLIQIQ